jgi:arsenate reductase-like glutaredoxin family protein
MQLKLTKHANIRIRQRVKTRQSINEIKKIFKKVAKGIRSIGRGIKKLFSKYNSDDKQKIIDENIL